jgi:hypothetical protein
MHKAMPTIPVSALRTRQAKILAQLGETRILLTQHGHAAGVLVHPDQWNRLITKWVHSTIDALEDQGDLATALAAELAVERGEEEVMEADIAELGAMAKGKQIPA